MYRTFLLILLISERKILGGSDDSAGCAIMLEILRIVTQSPKVLKHNIIFLFNGAEENILQV
jgi:Zn-dependent M28 family amino/carboxypeptidase